MDVKMRDDGMKLGWKVTDVLLLWIGCIWMSEALDIIPIYEIDTFHYRNYNVVLGKRRG